MPLKMYDKEDILDMLPHRGSALVIDSAICHPEDLSAEGMFELRADDPRIVDHFGILPGILYSEFAHLTGALLVVSCLPGEIEADSIVLLKKTETELIAPAMPGTAVEQIFCRVEIAIVSEDEKEITCKATIHNSMNKTLARVTFTGVIASKRLIERMVARKRR